MDKSSEMLQSVKDNFLPVEIYINDNECKIQGYRILSDNLIDGTTYFDGDVIFKHIGKNIKRPGFRISSLKFRRIIKWSFDLKNIKLGTQIQIELLDYVIEKIGDEKINEFNLIKFEYVHEFFRMKGIKMPVNYKKDKERLLSSIDPDTKI